MPWFTPKELYSVVLVCEPAIVIFFSDFSLAYPKGDPFLATVAQFPLQLPDYIFWFWFWIGMKHLWWQLQPTVCAQYVILVRVAWLLSFYSSKLDLHNFPIYITYLYLNVSVVVILDFLRYWLYQFTFYPPFTVYICMHI